MYEIALEPQAGLQGDKKLVEQYGTSLPYARYRYDENRGVRLKTVEIVVEEKPWKPVSRLRDEDIVPLQVAYNEMALRDQLKAVGGRWDPEANLWLVRYGAIRRTEVEKRVPAEFRKGKRRG